ncbi:hypothetical protein KC19_4G009700 [Ceratodon purpureus]|uniref:Uncharacterized protein n=1 Tax=Ceratodon purpureus TaxID=3225 RepID=A0A8T0I587_CERPU|nr:hypothetical protein KC19_4G009700 [Ceratodon purpureus]
MLSVWVNHPKDLAVNPAAASLDDPAMAGSLGDPLSSVHTVMAPMAFVVAWRTVSSTSNAACPSGSSTDWT